MSEADFAQNTKANRGASVNSGRTKDKAHALVMPGFEFNHNSSEAKELYGF